MATTLPGQVSSAASPQIAHPLHTVLLLAGLAALAVRSALRVEQMRAAPHLDHIRMYEFTILMEWAGLAFVLLGIWLAGRPVAMVLEKPWHSVLDVFRDIGIGAAFLIVSSLVLSVFQFHAPGTGIRDVQYLMPHGKLEIMFWILVSISAGICEETVFRGYLLRQFAAWTKSSVAGIVLSSVVFGLVHLYQGPGHALNIGFEGVLLGILAQWRKSVRPGIISHTLQDALAPLLIAATKYSG